MNSKERVLMAIEHREPDRVPVNATFTPEIRALLKQRFGECEDIGERLGNDLIITACGRGFETSYYRDGDEYMCEYGITWQRVPYSGGAYTEMVGYPLSGDKSALAGWNCPDPFEPSQYDDLRRRIELFGAEKWMVGGVACTLFETAWALRGLDQLLVDMLEDEDYVNELLEKVMIHPLHAGIEGAKLGLDMLWMGDDVAMQTGMLMSRSLFEKYLKPRFAAMIQAYREAKPEIKIAYHSCGNAMAILGDLIEIGVDVYHSIQPLAIDPIEVKRRYGDNLALWGGFDIQQIMPRGTLPQIRAEVKRLIDGCAGDGGFILSPAHHIQPDTPIENLLAFYEAAKEYGSYRAPA